MVRQFILIQMSQSFISSKTLKMLTMTSPPALALLSPHINVKLFIKLLSFPDHASKMSNQLQRHHILINFKKVDFMPSLPPHELFDVTLRNGRSCAYILKNVIATQDKLFARWKSCLLQLFFQRVEAPWRCTFHPPQAPSTRTSEYNKLL